LSAKLTDTKFERRPNFGEIEPTSEFEEMSKAVKLEQFVSASGMIPDKLLLLR